MLPDWDRVAVVDTLSQKLSNSGYRIAKIREILVGGLSSYEKRLRLSKLDEGNGYRPLHEDAGGTFATRNKKKLLGKSTWYKGGKLDEKREDLIDLDMNIQKTKQELRKEERKEKKRQRKEEKIKDGKMNLNNMETTSVMFMECNTIWRTGKKSSKL